VKGEGGWVGEGGGRGLAPACCHSQFSQEHLSDSSAASCRQGDLHRGPCHRGNGSLSSQGDAGAEPDFLTAVVHSGKVAGELSDRDSDGETDEERKEERWREESIEGRRDGWREESESQSQSPPLLVAAPGAPVSGGHHGNRGPSGRAEPITGTIP